MAISWKLLWSLALLKHSEAQKVTSGPWTTHSQSNISVFLYAWHYRWWNWFWVFQHALLFYITKMSSSKCESIKSLKNWPTSIQIVTGKLNKISLDLIPDRVYSKSVLFKENTLELVINLECKQGQICNGNEAWSNGCYGRNGGW